MTLVKACGIARVEDARLAVELGTWAIGLVLVPASPRACPPDVAEEVGATLRRRVEIAGVFANATLDEVALAAERFALSILQLHGDEGPAYCREAARRTGCRVMRAVRVRDAASVRALRPYQVDYHLLDAYSPRAAGGTGATFDWELARLHDRSTPLVLSGGLSADNVGEAIAAVRPWAVDSASGTEARPGVKDPARLEALFRAVAAADARIEAAAA
ncbi:MAG: phosphoribosylanthranilate isomerase [Thermoleophilaceae bacterium]|jgi:phosphoribosylanthranilate isomerase|nr:phosphoribosylanthranilate isomerase [Thermoleophilaceae bacterium]